MLAGLRVTADQVRCVGHCRHWCQGTSTLRLGGGRSRSPGLHHGSRSRGPGEAGGPGDGPGDEARGDGQAGAPRTSCQGAEGEARAAEDDSLVVVGPCRAPGSHGRASEINTMLDDISQVRSHQSALPRVCSACRQGLEL